MFLTNPGNILFIKSRNSVVIRYRFLNLLFFHGRLNPMNKMPIQHEFGYAVLNILGNLRVKKARNSTINGFLALLSHILMSSMWIGRSLPKLLKWGYVAYRESIMGIRVHPETLRNKTNFLRPSTFSTNLLENPVEELCLNTKKS